MHKTQIILFLSCVYLMCTTGALAQTLAILDCQGITRLIHQTKSGELNRVQINVADASGSPSNGTNVQLTNNVTGQAYTAQTASGSAVFPSVPPGSYSMAVSGSNLSVGTITIGSSGLGVAAAGGVLASGVAAGGGAVVGGVAVVDQVESQINGNAPAATPTVTIEPTPIVPTPSPTPPINTPEPTPTPCDCNPDAEPTPVDDFFGEPAAVSPYK